MPLSPRKYGRTLLAFMLVLALFLVGLDSFFFLREEHKRDLEQDEKARHDLELIGAFVVEPMLQQEFGKVEQFLLQWGRNTEDVVALHAFFPQGQTLAEFERDPSAADILTASTPIYFEGEHLLTLEIVKDRGLSAAPLQRFKRDLLIFSLTVTAFIGTVLWFLLRFMAIRPLEQEIARRQQAEEELRQAHDLLEARVEERTRELRGAVEDLHQEMVERHRTERELAAEKERLLVTLRSIGDGVISTDVEGRVTLLNKAAERLTGWAQHEGGAPPGGNFPAGYRRDPLSDGKPVGHRVADWSNHHAAQPCVAGCQKRDGAGCRRQCRPHPRCAERDGGRGFGFSR